MSTAEAAIQTHCDKIDQLAAATNEMVAAMNHRMERDAETIRVLREQLDAAIATTGPCQGRTDNPWRYEKHEEYEAWFLRHKEGAEFYVFYNTEQQAKAVCDLMNRLERYEPVCP